MPKLTARQLRFVEEYLVDMNASAAAIRAGYSEKNAGVVGYQLLQKTLIQEALQAKQKERSARTGITADRVIQEIARIAFSDPRAVMTWGGGGVSVRESSDLSDDEAAAIMEVSETVSNAGSSIKVKLHNKVDALEKLARHVGIYNTATGSIVIGNQREPMGQE